jgi:hypothetical protein
MAKKTTTKRRSRTSLEKDLDRVFSIFIRMRDANENGIANCFTCGKADHWTNMDNGHYISRVHRSTRWDEMNCHIQCKRCNIFMKGNYTSYALRMIQKYGIDILEIMDQRKHMTVKYGVVDFEQMIAHYRSINGQKLS